MQTKEKGPKAVFLEDMKVKAINKVIENLYQKIFESMIIEKRLVRKQINNTATKQEQSMLAEIQSNIKDKEDLISIAEELLNSEDSTKP